jgi:hypothetical protein
MKQRKGQRTILGSYKSYFFKEHDIVLDKVSRVIELAGMLNAKGQPDLRKIEEKSGVKYATLSRWTNRHVKRPQNAGVTAVINALGGRYEVMFGGKRVLAGQIVTRNDVLRAKAERKALRKIGRGIVQKRKAA